MYVPKRQEQDYKRQAALADEIDDFIGMRRGATEEYDDAPEFLKSRSTVELMDEANNNFTEKATMLVERLITAQNPNVLDRQALVQVASVQRERFFGCLSLPFSFLFFLLYAMSAALHEDITNVYFIESGLRNALSNGLDAISDIPSFWKWVRYDTLVPTIFDQTNVYGEPEKDKLMWNRVLMYNQLTGPLVLEQLRSEKNLCFDGDGIFGDMICYPKGTASGEAMKIRPAGLAFQIPMPETTDYADNQTVTLVQRRNLWQEAFAVSSKAKSRRLRIMRTEYMGKLPGGKGSTKEKFMAFFYPQTARSLIDSQMDYLQKGGWCDEQTKQIRAKVSLLNAEVGRPRLTQVKITFRFSRAGGVFARLTIKTIFLKMHHGGASMLADALFILMLGIVCVFEIMDGKKAWAEGKCREHLRKPWTILEYLIIFFGWLTIFGYLYQNGLRTTVRDDLKVVKNALKKDIAPEYTSTDESGDALNHSSDNYVFFTSYFQLLQAEYHLIVMFRFFTAFSAQPRLGVVTSTLEACVVDIIHFLIVLLPTFVAYAISGVFLFGRRLEEFATFDAAIGTCFKMAMEGEYDWPSLSTEHWFTAGLWTWTFMILIVLLMISMVLAIVMDVYTAKRKATGQSETVFVTLYNLGLRFRYSRVWVSNKDLIEKGSNMERLVHREELMKTFPGMNPMQLDALMTSVKYQSELDTATDMDLTDSMKMTMAVKLAIDKVNEDLKALQDGAFKGVAQRSDTEWLNSLADQMASNSHWMLGVQWKLQQLYWQWQAMQTVYGEEATFEPGGAPEDTDEQVVL
jgi:hypothetical protein